MNQVRIISAGVVVLHRQGDSYRYLLLRAYDYWDFPKGQVEAGETELQAAVREVTEETGLENLHFRWGFRFRETQPYNHGRKIARYYIAESRSLEVHLPINPELGRPEHSEFRWVARDEAWKLVTPRVRNILRWSDEVLHRSAARLHFTPKPTR